jgi:hypothetical protein
MLRCESTDSFYTSVIVNKARRSSPVEFAFAKQTPAPAATAMKPRAVYNGGEAFPGRQHVQPELAS